MKLLTLFSLIFFSLIVFMSSSSTPPPSPPSPPPSISDSQYETLFTLSFHLCFLTSEFFLLYFYSEIPLHSCIKKIVCLITLILFYESARLVITSISYFPFSDSLVHYDAGCWIYVAVLFTLIALVLVCCFWYLIRNVFNRVLQTTRGFMRRCLNLFWFLILGNH